MLIKKRVAGIGVLLSTVGLNNAPEIELSPINSYGIDNTKMVLDLSAELDTLQTKYSELEAKYNELDEKYTKLTTLPVFNPNDVTEVSGATVLHLQQALSESPQLFSLAKYFVQAEEKYGINAYVLASIVALESGWGTSEISKRDYNLTGYAVYDGLSQGKVFSSYEECIDATAELLAKHYVVEDGKYYTGKSLTQINTKYSSDEKWSVKVTDIAQTLIRNTEMWGVIEYE